MPLFSRTLLCFILLTLLCFIFAYPAVALFLLTLLCALFYFRTYPVVRFILFSLNYPALYFIFA